MPNYRRAQANGGTYFFTVVTYRRRPVFNRPECINFLRESITEVRRKHPFNIDAWVLLPDHMHCIWTLPDEDRDFSRRWGLLKSGFSKRAKDLVSVETNSASRTKHREATVWQRRFWEHQIRDEEDFNNHIDYIHYNPIKHGFVKRVQDWPFSTFHRYVIKGIYPVNWGDDGLDELEQDYGE
ncbi:MAG: transposase [Gammaproteobacteria bacterium]|nr:transposase [Gammaproteobacteria bacterium]